MRTDARAAAVRGVVERSDKRAIERSPCVGLSTSAAANGSVLGATSASGPRAAMS